jgi:hypothetical protein
MIVGDFHFVRTVLRPAETKAVLLVDSNAVLSFANSAEGFEAVAGRAFQVFQTGGGMENEKFGSCPPPDIRGESPGSETMKEFFGFFAGKAPDHV